MCSCSSQLYEEAEKPADAVTYLKSSMGGTSEDKVVIERLTGENEELKKKVVVELVISVLVIFFIRWKSWRGAR